MNTQAPRRATWRDWTALAVMTLPLLMAATDMSVLFMALPAIAADLSPGSTQMLWVLHAGEFVGVSLALTMGWLGRRVGRRRLLMGGVAVYGLASLVAAFAPTPEVLIAMRALMGTAAATMSPSIFGLLRVVFTDARQFSVAVAVVMSSFSGGMALGPPLGGVLLEHFSWGAVFLINVPVAALLLLATPLLPAGRERVEGSVDLPSVALSMGAIIAVVFGLQEIADRSASGSDGAVWPYLLPVVAGLVLGALFVRRQLRLPEPLMDMRLFATPAFTVSLGALLLMLLGYGAADMLLVQYLQTALGLSPAETGALMVVPALASIVGGLGAPLLTRWMRPSAAMGGGLLVASVAGGALALMVGQVGAAALISAATVMALALGPLFTLGVNLIVVSAPVSRAGSAAAMSDVAGGLGGALSMALLGSMAAVVYRRGLDGAGLDGIPGPGLEAAGESVGGAVGVAEGLPADQARQLLDAAFGAFTTAVQTGYGLGVALLAPTGIAVLWLLRRTRLDASEDVPEGREKAPEVA
ncbi:MFS transporter [Nocardiopsis sp. NPDC058789]|uniref:MFS transporter n=1 Tax=Nocardiopsis sp. NPDC058789 TaxID=3346634 RepID=UPI00366FB3A4